MTPAILIVMHIVVFAWIGVICTLKKLAQMIVGSRSHYKTTGTRWARHRKTKITNDEQNLELIVQSQRRVIKILERAYEESYDDTSRR